MKLELLFLSLQTLNFSIIVLSRFVYEDNIHDGYWLKMGIGKADLLKEKRIELLNKLNLLPNSEYFINKSSKPADGQLLSFLRVFNMNEGKKLHTLLKFTCITYLLKCFTYNYYNTSYN